MTDTTQQDRECAAIASWKDTIGRMQDADGVTLTMQPIGNSQTQSLHARIAELEAENTQLRDTLLGVLASLVAVRSLLNYDKPRLHVGSNMMFKQMLQDYDKSIEHGRQALKGETE